MRGVEKEGDLFELRAVVAGTRLADAVTLVGAQINHVAALRETGFFEDFAVGSLALGFAGLDVTLG